MQNDKLKLLKSGSLQHLGENMLAFLLQVAAKGKAKEADEKSGYDNAIYFDILVRCKLRLFNSLGKILSFFCCCDNISNAFLVAILRENT